MMSEQIREELWFWKDEFDSVNGQRIWGEARVTTVNMFRCSDTGGLDKVSYKAGFEISQIFSACIKLGNFRNFFTN